MKYHLVCVHVFNNLIKTSLRNTFKSIILGAASGEEIVLIKELCIKNNKNYYFYAVEANHSWIPNLQLLDNTDIINAAVSNTEHKFVPLYYDNLLKNNTGGTIVNSNLNKIEVNTIKLSTILNSIKHTELVSMDIQFAEEMVLKESINELNKYVLFLHILTHSESIETNIYNFLIDNNWKPIVNFPKKNKLYNNDHTDGLQIWLNNNFK